MATRIALVGPGAIGATVAALLHEAGRPVLLCGRTARDRLEVRPDDRAPIRVPGPVHTDPGQVDGPADVVLLAVKDTQNEASAPWLDRLCGEHTVVCALQNGVEQTERVGRFCPGARVVPAAVWMSAETDEQGFVRLRTDARLVLPATGAAQRLADTLATPHLRVECDPDFLTAAWHKLLVNAVVGLMVLTGRRAGMFRRDDIAALARAYLAECLAVARADGAALGDEVVDEVIGMLAASPPDITTSILTDREAGRALEWDIRNGVIARKGAAFGIATPISDIVVPLLAAAGDGPG
ncbi:2-dehydropantoate 2-reductase [Mycobacterium sp. IS-1742]|uniref:oxidoreductase n=1 Tax=Mycobacterium sp. IS-1742 TaxID=1772285 RepID=UPI00073FC268|nr:oxidoreductase [Mycobacterium sp. IS-1742]KUI31320.1 2-dehydropantoate 2-reductase [Mycobacterium sp. IS-1742]